MRTQVQAFKSAAIHACHLKGFSFVEFMEKWGLEEILIAADAQNRPAIEIAARVLAECCVTNGRFNNFQVGLLAVIKFLNDVFGPLGQGQEQSIRDLLFILNNGGSFQAIMGWMNSHYR